MHLKGGAWSMYTVIGPPVHEVIEAFGQKHAKPDFTIRFPDGKTEIHPVQIQGVIRTGYALIVTGYDHSGPRGGDNFFVLQNYTDGERGGGLSRIEDSLFDRYWGISAELQMHMLGVSCKESLEQQ